MLRNQLISLSVCLAGSLCALSHNSAKAQRAVDPNMGHFYMARQQVTITDDSPVINNKTNGGAGAPGVGAIQGGAPALAPARWQQYSPPAEQPSLSTSLPKVNKGLPTKGAMPGTGNSGRTGHLTGNPKAAAASKPQGPATAAGYTPYKKFAVEQGAQTSAGNGANTKVYGDVLHWARQRRNQ